MRRHPFTPWLRLERLAPTLSVSLMLLLFIFKIAVYEENDEIAASILLKQAPQHLLKGYFVGWDHLIGGLYQPLPDVPWMDVTCALLSLITAVLIAVTLAHALSDFAGRELLPMCLASIAIAGVCVISLSLVNITRYAILIPSLVWLYACRNSLRRGLLLTCLFLPFVSIRASFSLIGLVFVFSLVLLFDLTKSRGRIVFQKQSLLLAVIPIACCLGIMLYEDARYSAVDTDFFDTSVQIVNSGRCANIHAMDTTQTLIIESYRSLMVYDANVAVKQFLGECSLYDDLHAKLNPKAWVQSKSFFQALLLQLVPLFLLFLSMYAFKRVVIYVSLFMLLMILIHCVFLLFAKSVPRVMLPLGVLFMTVLLLQNKPSDIQRLPKYFIVFLLLIISGFAFYKQLIVYWRNKQYNRNNRTWVFDRPVILASGSMYLFNYKRLFDAPPITAPDITFIYGWPAITSNLDALNCKSKMALGEYVDCKNKSNDLHALLAKAQRDSSVLIGGAGDQDLTTRYMRHFYASDIRFESIDTIKNLTSQLEDVYIWRLAVEPSILDTAKGTMHK